MNPGGGGVNSSDGPSVFFELVNQIIHYIIPCKPAGDQSPTDGHRLRNPIVTDTPDGTSPCILSVRWAQSGCDGYLTAKPLLGVVAENPVFRE